MIFFKYSNLYLNLSIDTDLGQHLPHILTVYHIGRAANFRSNQENRIIPLGSYTDDAHLRSMLAKVDPHIIWFPAVRHESYCYILSILSI